MKTKELSEVAGYILIAAVNYPILFGLMFLCKEKLGFHDQLAFFLSYVVAYVIAYSLQANLLFKSGHSRKIASKYLLQIVIFFTLGNIIFYLLNSTFGWQYLLATVATILLLFPLRFLFSKLIVFK